MTLVTKQTGPEGKLVRTVLIEEALPIDRELYLGVVLDRSDRWTVRTRDGSLSAQFEHSIGVTEDGCQIFTLSPEGKFFPAL